MPSARCVALEYRDFRTVGWTLSLANSGAKDSPIVSDLRPLDLRLQRAPGGEFVLRRIRGDDCTPQSYSDYGDVVTVMTIVEDCSTSY